MTALFRLLSLLPLRALHSLGAALGLLAYALSPTYRNRLKANAALAEHAGIEWQAAKHAGRMALELPYLWLRTRKPLAVELAHISGWPHVQRALDAKRGIVFLTPHMGCFELCAQVLALHMPITVLYRPPKKAWLRSVVEQYRPRHNLATAPADLSGVRQMLRTLKNGGATGLLPDQVPQAGEGVLAPFFGKPAFTMTFPAKLKQMTGADMLLVTATRRPRGQGFDVSFTPFEEALPADATDAAAQINVAMEQLIAQCPEQYLWGYNRYKLPAKAQGAAS
jgi:Kdo2-lipid IVA lauroyltransferase/acyltransferase